MTDVDWKLVLEYLRVFLSWPVITGVLAFVLVYNFKEAIKLWLSNLQIKYGGAEFSVRQSARTEPEFKLPASQPKISTDSTPLNAPTSNNPYEQMLTGKNESELRNLVMQWRANAYLWEYKYLNKFLVANTQLVLDWLYEIGKPVTLEFAENFWGHVIPLRHERSAIITALTDHYLAYVNDGCIEITPKGREYVEMMGKSITSEIYKSLPTPKENPKGLIGH